MAALKLRKIGKSVGVVFPAEMLRHLHAGIGDTIYVMPTTGGLRLTPCDPTFEKQMTAIRTVMGKNRNALRQLAK